MKRFLFSLLLCCQISFSQIGFTARNAMVVSARIEASEIGSEIMRQGGNAFDAAIAVQLALAVAYPYAGNISGGGFMVYRMNDGTSGSLDFRETAPLKASRDMFLDKNGNVIPNLSLSSAKAVGVPGSVAGIFEMHKKFGSLPIEKLFAPAIALARKGIVVTGKQLKQITDHKKEIISLNGNGTIYSGTFKIGDTIKYPELAQTLERIEKNGANEFYKGRSAKMLIRFIAEKGGILSAKDLRSYKAIWRKPIEFDYRNIHVISMGLPSSGGFCLNQMFKMIEPFDVSSLPHNSVDYITLLTEAEKRSYADRNYFLADPDFIKSPQNQLIDTTYLHHRLKSSDLENIIPSSQISHGDIPFSESDQTTHFSIVDPFGNAVSVTTTLNGAFGSKLYCAELGFFLNNEMDDFSIKAGTQNYFGLTGSKANAIEPGKRMLSSMTPTIVEKEGKLFMVLGSPGGSTIITSIFQNILNVAEFDMGMQQSVGQPRMHHQWLPDDILMEPDGFSGETIKQLKDKGYKINIQAAPVIGKVDAILQLPNGTYEAGADPRGDDAAAGF
ncbi:gamma-glutamyltransferase [Flavobacterium silvaticum]|uniref:Glutathione hydrolase proenzyme n=1 Tax=Flavobacterium silvaticum TaxID=1852020 RepID=A0A972G1N6_9FLAO|nr:gamma-glutamyltransferase [Flavobacterium silvaticum]NMH28821.1 gamma-glutamyltransferase [Flavobacterium silvaticum]